MDYNQSYVVTSSEYSSILQQKNLNQGNIKSNQTSKKKEKEDKKAQWVVDSFTIVEITS
jgi:hypothetical protein